MMPERSEVALRTYQRDFVNQFRSLAAGRRVMLIAPAGAGKTTMALTLLRELATGAESFHALYITSNRRLAEQLQPRLTSDQLPSVRLDKRILREIGAEVTSRSLRQRSSIVIVNSSDLRDGWFRSSLRLIDWDVVVVDDDQLLQDSVDVVEELVTPEDASILWLSPTEPAASVGAHWEVVHWGSFEGQRGPETGLPIRIHIVPFERAPDERRLIEAAIQTTSSAQQSGWSLGWLDLRGPAYSSPYALQAACLEAVDRLWSLRNELAHGRVGPGAAETREGDDRNGTEVIRVVAQLEFLIDEIDQLGHDTRLDSLIGLLRSELIPRPEDPVVVYTSERRTRDYLARNLTNYGFTVDADSTLETSDGTSGAVLVVDDASLQGVAVQSRRGIGYDAIGADDLAHARLGHLDVGESNSPAEYWLLADVSFAGSTEEGAVAPVLDWIRTTRPLWLAGTRQDDGRTG